MVNSSFRQACSQTCTKQLLWSRCSRNRTRISSTWNFIGQFPTCTRVCTRLHHHSDYSDSSYVGPVTSSLCRHRTASPSTSVGRGRGWAITHSQSLVRAPGTHFLLTFVVHSAWTLLRSVSSHVCFLLLTSYNNLCTVIICTVLATSRCKHFLYWLIDRCGMNMSQMWTVV